MSATVTLHGPFKAGARLINHRKDGGPDFVSVDIGAGDTNCILVSVSSDDLDSLAEAITAARKVLPA